MAESLYAILASDLYVAVMIVAIYVDDEVVFQEGDMRYLYSGCMKARMALQEGILTV